MSADATALVVSRAARDATYYAESLTDLLLRLRDDEYDGLSLTQIDELSIAITLARTALQQSLTVAGQMMDARRAALGIS